MILGRRGASSKQRQVRGHCAAAEVHLKEGRYRDLGVKEQLAARCEVLGPCFGWSLVGVTWVGRVMAVVLKLAALP